MNLFAFYSTLTFFLVLCAIFALLILIQKGRGGGISAAFGGAGGNTAFGSKTGDVLTWATSIVFFIFLVTCVSLNLLAGNIDRAYVKGQSAVVAPSGAAPTDLPAVQRPVNPSSTQPSIVPPQDRNPQGITEPAVTQPSTVPASH